MTSQPQVLLKEFHLRLNSHVSTQSQKTSQANTNSFMVTQYLNNHSYSSMGKHFVLFEDSSGSGKLM